MTEDEHIDHLEKQIEYMSGEIGALKAFCSAMTLFLPDPGAMAEAFELVTESVMSGMLNEAVADATLDGLRDSTAVLREGLLNSAAKANGSS